MCSGVVAYRGVTTLPPAPPESNVEGEKLHRRWCEILSVWQDPLLASTLHPGGAGGPLRFFHRQDGTFVPATSGAKYCPSTVPPRRCSAPAPSSLPRRSAPASRGPLLPPMVAAHLWRAHLGSHGPPRYHRRGPTSRGGTGGKKGTMR